MMCCMIEWSDSWGSTAEVAHSCLMRRRKSMMGSCVMGFLCRTSPTCRYWRRTSPLCPMLCVWMAMLHMYQIIRPGIQGVM